MATKVLKWDVPVDDQDHPVGGGKVLFVTCQGTPYSVQVWTQEIVNDNGDLAYPFRRVRVYGTGQTIPDGDSHIGSTLAASFVWHLYGNRS